MVLVIGLGVVTAPVVEAGACVTVGIALLGMPVNRIKHIIFKLFYLELQVFSFFNKKFK